MENASKAIIIAGAVLIAILVISIGLALWVRYSNFSLQAEENRRAQQLSEFNTKFEKYRFNDKATEDKDKNYISAQDVRTIVNYAKEFNNKYETTDIKVIYNGLIGKNSDILKWDEKAWIGFLNTSNAQGKKYRCYITEPESKDIIREIMIKDE